MREYTTHSREETVALGRALAKDLPAGALVAFTGGLGAGKTAFCQGLAEGLGCTDPVSSPTFAIVNYYRGPRPLAHFDLYEWSENCAALLAQEQPLYIDIERVDDTTRHITIR